MATEVRMPKLGMAMREGTISLWLKKQGQTVKADEAIVEIMTDKVNYELEAPVDGRIIKICVKEGETVPIGTPIAYIGGKEEKIIEQDLAEDSLLRESRSNEELLQEETIPEKSRIKKVITLQGIKAQVAKRMRESWKETPRVTAIMSVDMTNAVRTRNEHADQWIRAFGVKPSFNDIVVKAVAQVLANFEIFNAEVLAEKIYVYKDVNIGIALDSEEGKLVVPVVKQADKKSLGEIAKEAKILIEKAGNDKLEAGDLEGGTFTVTNLGMFGVDVFTPIVNFPQVGILGVGAICKRPAVIEDKIGMRSIMKISLVFNHAVVNGLAAAKFLSEVRNVLESPKFIVMDMQ